MGESIYRPARGFSWHELKAGARSQHIFENVVNR